jgi:endonuclease YncB( thermonuclease family)
MVACLLPAVVGAGEEDIKKYAGKILLDVASHGEAWYVNPATLQRVYLGKPEEALQRLTKRAVWMNFSDIERIAVDGAVSPDPEFAARMAGYVIAPNDLLGAPWYVHPVLKGRIVLATPNDAWIVMRTGEPVEAKILKMIPVETDIEFVPAGNVQVKEVKSTDTLVLEDGTEVRLMSVDAPDNAAYQTAAKARMSELISANGNTVNLEADMKDADKDGLKLRLVTAGAVMLNLEVVRQGWAFHNVEFPNYKDAELLIVGGIDAQMHQNGFWNK